MQFPHIFKRLSMLGLALFCTACVRLDPPKPPAGTEFLPVKGEARVVEIHGELNYIMMKTQEGTIKGWWDEHSRFFAGPAQVQSLSLRPGDRVRYQGVKAYKEIYVHQLFLMQ